MTLARLSATQREVLRSPSDAARHLLTVNITNPPQVTDTLEGFYRTVHSTHINRGHDTHVAQDVVRVISSWLERQFRQLPNRTEDQNIRMDRALRGFRELAYELDELDRTRPAHENPQYHHNPHNMLVMAARLIIGRAIQGARPWTAEDLIHETRALTEALNHDHGHDGTTNKIIKTKIGNETKFEKVDYIPGRLETLSYDFLEPMLDKHRATDKEKDHARWVIYSTDPGLPGEIRKWAHAYHYEDGTNPHGRIAVMPLQMIVDNINETQEPHRRRLFDYLTALVADKKLTDDCMRLNPADMITFGFSQEMWRNSCHEYHKEMQGNSSGIKIIYDDGDPRPAGVDLYDPRPAGQVSVILSNVGARIDREGNLYACFAIPEADFLLSKNLKKIEKAMTDQLSETELQNVRQDFLKEHRAFEDSDRQAWNNNFRSNPGCPPATANHAALHVPAQ